jgi:predicted O-methyltransferase YrrM
VRPSELGGHARARQLLQRMGLDPRYIRRFRWISKAQAVRRLGQPLRSHLPYLLLDPEVDNFTYGLANMTELGAWVASVCGVAAPDARSCVCEPGQDQVLQSRMYRATAAHRLWSKSSPPFGKRLGWYAIARLRRPRLIVETGVHDGLASLLLLRALERNADEGCPGRLLSFDINPTAGWLAGDHPLWQLEIRRTEPWLTHELEKSEPVDLFIHDSLHTYENELFELRTAADHLAPGGVLISDNAHATPALREVAAERGLRRLEFREVPHGHFYTGGITAAAVADAAMSSAVKPTQAPRCR